MHEQEQRIWQRYKIIRVKIRGAGLSDWQTGKARQGKHQNQDIHHLAITDTQGARLMLCQVMSAEERLPCCL